MSKLYKGKAACCIEMLYYLNTGRKYSVSELAERIETNPRNIVEYKKELDEVAAALGWPFSIETIPGRNGGYRLKGDAVLPSFQLNAAQKEALVEAFDYVMAKKDFMNKTAFERAFANVMASIEAPGKNKDLMVVDKYQLTMGEKDIQSRYLAIQEAIETKKQVAMVYESLKHGSKEYVVDPYKLFIYNNSWFFLAWSQEAGDVHYFKINRIKSIRFTGKKFAVWSQFRPEKYFDQQGLLMNGDFHHCVFLAKGVRASLFKERIYGNNQVVEEVDGDTVKVTLDMQNEETILYFVLGCGDKLKVLEPAWLKERVIAMAQAIQNQYQEEA